MHFLSFKLGDITYVIDTTCMQEIIELQETSPVPNAPPFIDGVINLRGKIIPILNLSKRIGSPSGDVSKRKILILKMGNTLSGIIVDSIERIFRAEEVEIEEVPPLALAPSNIEFVKGVVKKDKRILMLLDIEKVLSSDEKNILDLEIKDEMALSIKKYDESNQLQLIGFTLSNLAHAIEMEKVQKIIKMSQLTPLPGVPDFIKGLINLRGEVVLVIDIRSFLGLEITDPTPSARIIITKVNNKTLGISVDDILQVLKIPQDLIQLPLPTLEQQSQEFIKGEFLYANQLFVLIDLEKIISSKEIKKWQS